jgi:hypothetical protein
LNFFFIFFFFLPLDPDPDSESGSGSRHPIESGSNTDPDPQPCLRYRHLFCYVTDVGNISLPKPVSYLEQTIVGIGTAGKGNKVTYVAPYLFSPSSGTPYSSSWCRGPSSSMSSSPPATMRISWPRFGIDEAFLNFIV